MNKTGSGILTVFYKYIRYKLRAGHKKGRGVHSSFVFELVSKVIYNYEKKIIPGSITGFYKSMLKCNEELQIIDYGPGSRVTSSTVRKVSSIAKHSSISHKYGEILYRLSEWYRPGAVLELGTGIGLSTIYLSAGSPGVRIITVEGSPEKIQFAREQLTQLGVNNVEFVNEIFDDCLHDLLKKMKNHCLIFVDGDHRYEPTVKTVEQIIESEHLEEVIVVLDDIHWSDGMEKAWKKLSEDERISISLNLFFMGILIIRPGIKKQHFNISL